MKTILLIFLLCLFGFAVYGQATLTGGDANKIADAIKKIENSHKYPYGIKSVNTHGNENKARTICLNTIKNNFARWQKGGSRGDYLEFLANVYCPKSADLQGNRNWIKNVKFFLKK